MQRDTQRKRSPSTHGSGRLIPRALASILAATALLAAPVFAASGFAQTGDALGVDEVIANAGSYYGQTVTVTGDVANIVNPLEGMNPLQGMMGPLAFTVVSRDQSMAGAMGTGASSSELLVLRAPTTAFTGSNLDLAPRDSIRAEGTVIVFNQAEVERTTGLRLDDQMVQDWDGRPALVAWNVTEVAATDAQAGPGDARGGPTEFQPRPTDQKEPATVNLITQYPASYYGRVVTVGGEVVNVFEPTGGMMEPLAFTIAADGQLDGDAGQQPILVIRAPVTAATGSMSAMAPGDQLRVMGPVVMFNVAEIEQATGLDLDNQLLQAWDGQPAIIAWNVSGVS